MFSYCNSGYAVLGRLVEVLRGKPFDTVLHERLAAPLHLTHVTGSAVKAIRFPTAVGHTAGEPDAPLTPMPGSWLTASDAPTAGLVMTARDLLGFAHMHLNGGLAADGTRILGADSARAMREPQIAVPDIGIPGTHWGLGWMLPDCGGPSLFGHDGSIDGQTAFVRIAPQAGIAVALLANGGDVRPMFDGIVGEVLNNLAGIRLPAPPVPPANPEPVDARRVRGRYRSAMLELAIDVDTDGRAWLQTIPRTPEATLEHTGEPEELVALHPDALITAYPHHGQHLVYALLGENNHSPARFLHNSRAMPRHPNR